MYFIGHLYLVPHFSKIASNVQRRTILKGHHCSSRALQEVSWDFQWHLFNFPHCLILPSSLPYHRYQSQEHSLIDIFSDCFLGSPSWKTALEIDVCSMVFPHYWPQCTLANHSDNINNCVPLVYIFQWLNKNHQVFFPVRSGLLLLRLWSWHPSGQVSWL